MLNNIGKKIMTIRKSKNISQQELAVNSDLSQPFISHLEQDKRSPTINTLYKIAHGLDVSFRDFLLYLINEYEKDEIS